MKIQNIEIVNNNENIKITYTKTRSRGLGDIKKILNIDIHEAIIMFEKKEQDLL